MNALPYLIKANLYGLLFVGCYWLLLRRHTFFGLNRAYLLVSAVLSLMLPLVHLPTETADTLAMPVGVIPLPTTTVAAVSPALGQPHFGPDWEIIGAWAYGLVAGGLLLRLLLRTHRLLNLIRQSSRQGRGGYVLVQPNDPAIPTFSFFRYLVLSSADADNALIVQHERVHIRQGHSLDVLVLAVLRAVFWACPALGLIDRALRQVHEFLADTAVRQSTGYAQFLVDYAFGIRPDALTNGFFNPSLLKQRVQMLHQQTTSRWALGKYMLILPLAFGLLAMTTAREKIATVATATDNTVTVSGLVGSAATRKPLSGAHVIIKGTNQGTDTDADGRYVLKNVPKTATLVFSFVGHKSQAVRVNGHTTLVVNLGVVSDRLHEIVVTPESGPIPALAATAPTRPNSLTNPSGDKEVFTVVEQTPSFPGGMSALGQYLGQTLRYPVEARQNRVQGRVFVQFIIAETGAIRDVRILKGIGSGCDEEAVRVVGQMPNWEPGRQNGKPVAVQYNLPIKFSLETKAKQTGQYEPVQGPTQRPIGDFPTARASEYPHQPRFTTTSVRITGNGPLGPLGEQPLYIVDGKEMSADSFKTVNVARIERLTVLKEAASTVSYGEKGKNGVLIITLKKE